MPHYGSGVKATLIALFIIVTAFSTAQAQEQPDKTSKLTEFR